MRCSRGSKKNWPSIPRDDDCVARVAVLGTLKILRPKNGGFGDAAMPQKVVNSKVRNGSFRSEQLVCSERNVAFIYSPSHRKKWNVSPWLCAGLERPFRRACAPGARNHWTQVSETRFNKVRDEVWRIQIELVDLLICEVKDARVDVLEL